MFRITGEHLPAGVIADLACGLPVEGWRRSEIEAHLAACADCREELALARDGRPELRRWQRARRLGAPAATWAGWRPLALAASLVALLAAGASWWPPRPKAGLHEVALVELVPDSYRVRGDDGAGAAADPRRPTTLVLTTDQVLDATAYRVRVLSAGGEPVVELGDLQLDATGAFVVHAAPGALPAGELTLALEAAGPGGWVPVESYRLRVGG